MRQRIVYGILSVAIALISDYAHVLQVQLRGLDGRDTPLLKAATIKRLHTSPVSPPDKYGLGWGCRILTECQQACTWGAPVLSLRSR